MTYEDIAKIAHEVNRAYCLFIGDDSQVAWNDAPQWQKDSAINGVKFHAENPNTMPEDSHINWLKDKLADGWRWGPHKNADKKEHPCICEYKFLPEFQQVKDHLFLAVCRAALKEDK